MSPLERRRKMQEIIKEKDLSFEFFWEKFETPYPTYQKYKAGDSAPRQKDFDKMMKVIEPEEGEAPPGAPPDEKRESTNNPVGALEEKVEKLANQVELLTRLFGEKKRRLRRLRNRGTGTHGD